MFSVSIPRCEPSAEGRDLPFHWIQWRTPFRCEHPQPWQWDAATREWLSLYGQRYSPERAAQLQYHYVAPARVAVGDHMPLTGDDFDRNPEIVIAVLRHYSEVVTTRLRELSRVAANNPHITAERALNDAATMIEKALGKSTGKNRDTAG